jgi:hypothetical protein
MMKLFIVIVIVLATMVCLTFIDKIDPRPGLVGWLVRLIITLVGVALGIGVLL